MNQEPKPELLSGVNRLRIKEIVRSFRGRRVMVAGDIMLDEFVWGSVHRISPEAPVPVVQVQRQSVHLGGAANVGCNLAALGAIPIPVGVLGERRVDGAAQRLYQEYGQHSSELEGLIEEGGRSTTVKTRIIAHHQQVCRTDREDLKPLRPETRRRLVEAYRELSNRAEATIVSDYSKGVLFPALIRAIQSRTDRYRGVIYAVDPKVPDFKFYGRPTVLTPNKHEAEIGSGVAITDMPSLLKAGRQVLRSTRARNVIITRGEEGMSIFPARGQVTHIPAMAREVYDVTGAGDTVIATLTLALTAGASIVEAAAVANFAAAIVVGKLGTATVTAEELLHRLEHYEPADW